MNKKEMNDFMAEMFFGEDYRNQSPVPQVADFSGGDLLREMFEMQTILDTRIIDQRGISMSTSEWVTKLTVAMESEIDEIRREINWKWWKDEKSIDVPALQSEVIDMWHFLLALSRVVGLNPQDIHRQYMAKNAENHARQTGTSERSSEGYTAPNNDSDPARHPWGRQS